MIILHSFLSSMLSFPTYNNDSINDFNYGLLDIMVKPDGVQRRVVGDIIHRFEKKGFQLKGLKLTVPNRDLLEEHYRDLKSKPFFPKLMSYMTSGPVVAMVRQDFLQFMHVVTFEIPIDW